ncbi:MAG TPA: KDGP aldolase [Bacillota bacterium]|nr:KDGP aldolase [Bacillota bacterium]
MSPSFYKDFICINVLAKDVENAKEVYEKTNGHCLIGLLSSHFSSVTDAVKEIRSYHTAVDGAISIGLGGGNPDQWKMVCDITREVDIPHINQVFPKVGYTYGISKNKHTWINALVHPTDKVGYVNIATGPESGKLSPADIPVRTAIAIIKEMGGNALKLFPLKGLQLKDHYKHIAEICAEENFPLEPTGGITLENFQEIITIAKDAGIKKLIPHVHSSIVDQSTGLTNINAIERLYSMMQEVTDNQ